MTDAARGEEAFDLAGYRFVLRWRGAAAGRVAQRLYRGCRVDAEAASSEAAPSDVYEITEAKESRSRGDRGAAAGTAPLRARRGEELVAAAAAGGLRAHRGDVLVAEANTEIELVAHLDAAIANAALEHLTGAVAVHAGAVARGDRGLLLAGAGGSGKTTLTAALALEGLCPLCDDMVLVEESAPHLRALPRNLLIKGDTARWVAERVPAGAEWRVDDDLLSLPRDLLGPPVDRAEATWVVFPRYRPHAATRLEALGHLAAVERLLPLACLPHIRLPHLVDVVRRSRCFDLSHASRDEAVAALRPLVWD